MEDSKLMICRAAKEIKDTCILIVGTGKPLVIGILAKRTHAPNCKLVAETGNIDFAPSVIPKSIGGLECNENSKFIGGFLDSLGAVMNGTIGFGIIGGAEVDVHGNINSMFVGDKDKPEAFFGGAGGANDIATHVKKLIIIMPHEKRRFPKNISHITSPPLNAESVKVITSRCVFERIGGFLKVIELFPNTTKEEIIENTEFEVEFAPELKTTEAPAEAELNVLKELRYE